jgi:hypothetical protein
VYCPTAEVHNSFTGLLLLVGHAVEALCYKLEDRWFESRMRRIFFNLRNPSSRSMALGSTLSKKRPACRADNLAAIYESNV